MTDTQTIRDRIIFLRRLRAVRDFRPEPVPQAVIDDMLDVVRWSGSASNRQPAEVVVVRDTKVLQQIADGGVRPAGGAPLALVVVTAGDPERKDLEVFDEGRLVERLLLAAKAHGLGANIGTLKGDGPTVIKQALGIPAERRIWTVVTLGQIDQAARPGRPQSPTAGRKPLEEFAHWDRY